MEPVLPDPEVTLLPFVRRETDHGPLCVRRERLGRSHHVGRMCVDDAARADPRLLALLALDPGLAAVDPRGALYLDTETTGLGGGAGVLAFLVGLAWFDADGALVLEQLLLQRPGEEDALLELLRERIEAASVLVTYNGKAFDLPLLRGRCVMNRRPALPARPHLDLLHVARRLHKRRLGACRLIGLEADVLGYVRVGDIEGGDVAARYAHYLRSGDEGALAAVVEHNALDVLSMAALVSLYGEPFDALHDEDLIGLAQVLRRAKALDQARVVAERAVERAVDPEALRVRGEIAKARGDRAAALLDFEAFARDVDDEAVRLELAKLYEHHVKSPEKPWGKLGQGTGGRRPAPAHSSGGSRPPPLTPLLVRRPRGAPPPLACSPILRRAGAARGWGYPEGYTQRTSSRYKRMNGFNVLHPMGWDAFGLPAEQYALSTGTHPAITTARNVNTFRKQIKSLGFSYDWSREVDTTDPGYYRWTQWIFLQLYKKGLAYVAEVPVNWCPALGTVLANEEVKDGLSERGGHPVVRRPMKQWMLRITAYADRLLERPRRPRLARGHQGDAAEWIGRSFGAEVDFPLQGHEGVVTVFTTRPDTLFGATYMVLAPEHALVSLVTTDTHRDAVHAYIEAAARKSDLERTELQRTRPACLRAPTPSTPSTAQRIPIWIGDYVLATYGTGAIMAVPGHDERDWDFATAFGLPIVEVVSGGDVTKRRPRLYRRRRPGQLRPHRRPARARGQGEHHRLARGARHRQGHRELPPARLALQPPALLGRALPPHLRGWPAQAAARVRAAPAPARGRLLQAHRHRRKPAGRHRPTGSKSPCPMAARGVARPTPCPSGPARAGTTCATSTPTTPSAPGTPTEKYWMPVDLYVGGAEHAVLHLLYARFWHKVLYDWGWCPPRSPSTRLFNQGMILGEPQLPRSPGRTPPSSPPIWRVPTTTTGWCTGRPVRPSRSRGSTRARSRNGAATSCSRTAPR